MLKVQLQLIGPVLTGGIDAKGDIIDPAADRAIEHGLRTARELTPVRTGLAQSSWYSETRGERKFIANDQPYVQYLEEGTRYIRPYRMAAQAAKVMDKQYASELSNQVDRVLG